MTSSCLPSRGLRSREATECLFCESRGINIDRSHGQRFYANFIPNMIGDERILLPGSAYILLGAWLSSF